MMGLDQDQEQEQEQFGALRITNHRLVRRRLGEGGSLITILLRRDP
jgi:hypothetical protein